MACLIRASRLEIESWAAETSIPTDSKPDRDLGACRSRPGSVLANVIQIMLLASTSARRLPNRGSVTDTSTSGGSGYVEQCL